MAISTSSPVAGPSPCVVFRGFLLMPFTTVLRTVKLGFSSVVVKRRVFELASRVAESISTSAGELARLGTLPDGGSTEAVTSTRDLLDWVVRKRLLRVPNVEILEGCIVKGLLGNTKKVDGASVSFRS